MRLKCIISILTRRSLFISVLRRVRSARVHGLFPESAFIFTSSHYVPAVIYIFILWHINKVFTVRPEKYFCGQLVLSWTCRGNMSQHETLKDHFLPLQAVCLACRERWNVSTYTSSCFVFSLSSHEMWCFLICVSNCVHVVMRLVCSPSFAVLRDLSHLKHQGLRWGCSLISLATKRNTGWVKKHAALIVL